MTESTVDSFAVTVNLRYALNMLGYAVYMRLVELCGAAPDKRLRYDVKALAWEMRVEEKTVESVVRDFGLFVVGDGYIEDAHNKSEATILAEKKEALSVKRSIAGLKGAQTKAHKKVDAEIDEQVVAKEMPLLKCVEKTESAAPKKAPEVYQTFEDCEVVFDDTPVDPAIVETREKLEVVRNAWNETFKGTRRLAQWLDPPADVWHEFSESIKYHEVQDFVDAFKEARKDARFSWTFRIAIKDKNVTMLCGRTELAEQQKKNEEENLTLAQRENLEYVRRHGIEW